MNAWQTSEEIGRNYAVGAGRLMAYAERGNLGCRRTPDGGMLFNAAHVERLFVPRGTCLQLPMMRAEQGFGTLGAIQLGKTTVADHESEMSGPSARTSRRSKVTRASRRFGQPETVDTDAELAAVREIRQTG